MRKHLKLVLFMTLVAPLSVFADNLIFNGGFDMTPWDTGWVASESGTGEIQADTSKDTSSPNACLVLAWGMSGSGGYGTLVQTIYPPAINCTCRAFFKYSIGVSMGGNAGVQLKINKNNNWETEWSDEAALGENIDSTKNWIVWEKVYTVNDTIRGIHFYSGSVTYSPSNSAGAYFWLDNVYISGEKIGIEEKSNIKNPSTTLRASPNPFVQSTVISCQSSRNVGSASGGFSLAIYDIAGKLIKETKGNVITAKAGCSIGKDLKTGIYFVKMNNYKPVKIVKMSYIQ
ncbi:MAG: T9SS type A sorting domain-containing protein [bacterium]|nr:T9SS type A sorting domain-containing protein [bacterium]